MTDLRFRVVTNKTTGEKELVSVRAQWQYARAQWGSTGSYPGRRNFRAYLIRKHGFWIPYEDFSLRKLFHTKVFPAKVPTYECLSYGNLYIQGICVCIYEP